MNKLIQLLIAFSIIVMSFTAVAKDQSGRQKEDKQHVRTWNRFAEALVQLHKYQLETHDVRTTENKGGYGGLNHSNDFYREVHYYDKATGNLLSIVKWEKENPDTVHTIEVNVYNQDNELARDYLAAWLPGFRNAPVQTLINLHSKNGELAAFRQFDAEGERIYESCQGNHFGKDIDISIEDYELSPFATVKPAVMSTEVYTECFGYLPTTAGAYLNPLSGLPLAAQKRLMKDTDVSESREGIEFRIKQLDAEIAELPKRAELYIERGDLHFKLQQFDSSINDFSKAISLDDSLDSAWFGRGMARGHGGQISKGIADLTVFIERNPKSSLAYTKRGVRYIWNDDYANAEKDLRYAIELDETNAEAHDDLAVILAQRKEYDNAISHLQKTIKYEPSYQKGFHNLATVYFITSQFNDALAMVNEGLALDPNSRDSLLLKGEILIKLGQHETAKAIIEEAEFLPESSWASTTPIR